MKQVVHTTKAPQAIGPYSQAVASGELLYTSGQLGIDMETGKLAEGSAPDMLQKTGPILAA